MTEIREYRLSLGILSTRCMNAAVVSGLGLGLGLRLALGLGTEVREQIMRVHGVIW